MKRSTDRILTTHAGSMIRPPEVLALGPDTDEPTTTATLRNAVAAVVRQQAELGIDVISDGVGRDEKRYPDFFRAAEISQLGGQRHVCVAPIKYIGKAVMQRDVSNFVEALHGVSVEGAFLPVVSPTSISVDHTNEYYASHEEYLAALADALHEEYATITDAGLIVQLDDAILTHFYDRMMAEGSITGNGWRSPLR